MRAAVECAYTITGEGPPVFFVHGIGASRATWAPVIECLRTGYTCIAYDLRGHGASPRAMLPTELSDLVVDLEHLRTRLGIASAHVVGHSLGGMIGPAYAHAHPQRVCSLGLVSTAAGRTAEDRERLWHLIREMENAGVEATLGRLIERWFTPAFAERHPEVVEQRRRRVLATNESVFLDVFRLYAKTEMGPWIDEVKTPALVMTGENDGGCSPRHNEWIAARLPRAEPAILSDLRHAIPLEAPGAVADRLHRFMQSNACPAQCEQ